MCSSGDLENRTASSGYRSAYFHLTEEYMTSMWRWNVLGAMFRTKAIGVIRNSSWWDAKAGLLRSSSFTPHLFVAGINVQGIIYCGMKRRVNTFVRAGNGKWIANGLPRSVLQSMHVWNSSSSFGTNTIGDADMDWTCSSTSIPNIWSIYCFRAPGMRT